MTLNLSNAERQTFTRLYAFADPNQSGMITGDAAVKFFEGFKLPTLTLGKIWAIADEGNNGFLTPNNFGVALRLIGRAQRGESVSESVVQVQGAPPVYEGLAAAPAAPAANAAETTINAEDKARFSRIFASAGPTNGLLSGEQAKDLFVKSKLPFAKLGAIWNLADTKSRGALDLADFVIGMHYIQGTMNGTVSELPATLPAGMYEQASVQPTTPALQAQRTGTDPVMSTFFASPAQPSRTSSVAVPSSTSLMPQPTGAAQGDWAISAQEKAKFDTFFDSLDTAHTGHIEGSLVVPFFMQSGLDEPTLAHVWDLSDLTQDGVLTRDEFAVAMRLINDKIAGRAIPDQLPPNMMPPGMRAQSLPEAVDVKQSETQKELFSLLDFDAPPVSSAAAATAFAGSNAATSLNMPPMRPAVLSKSTAETQTRAPASRSTTAQFNAFDDDVAAPAPDPAELAGTQSAMRSTSKDLDDLRTRRSTVEATAAQNATSLAELEAQLTRARTEQAGEKAAVAELEERVLAQGKELDVLREDVIRTESELSGLRSQKDELEQTLLQDRESVRETKRTLAELQADLASMRDARDRAEEEVRHHAGIAAIADTQLAAARDEHESLLAMPPVRAEPVAKRNPFEMGGEPPSAGTATFESMYGSFATAEPLQTDLGLDTFAGIAGVGAGTAMADSVEPRAQTVHLVDPTGAPATASFLADPSAEGNAHAAVDSVDVGEHADQLVHDTSLDESAYLDASPHTRDDAQGKDQLHLPGGFPGEADAASPDAARAEPSSAQAPPLSARVANVQQAPSDWSAAAAPASAAAAASVPAPAPRAGLASMWPTGAAPESTAPESTLDGAANARPATTVTDAPSARKSTLDEFDSAFKNLGFAHVVPSSADAAVPQADAEQRFESSFAPASASASAPGKPLSPAPAYGEGVPLAYLSNTATAPPVHAPTAQAAPAAQAAPDASVAARSVPSAPGQRSSRAPTPPLPGDLGPVRQLCQMGFSRSQVIRALERANYRTERALERLLSNSGRA
ncbi:hypothetical protein MVES1_001914 [Malassezia vespertilionis]|nr:uncharacterized protein MVES1_001914 [Malassezia vespertilionis]WFD06563.1 hypothetical protein MVES1_001914 [Malassezia vespertilionis]